MFFEGGVFYLFGKSSDQHTIKRKQNVIKRLFYSKSRNKMHTYPYKHTRKNTHIHTPCSRKFFQTNPSDTRAVKNESQKTRTAWRLLWYWSRAVQSGETSWYPSPCGHLWSVLSFFVFVSAICVAGADAGAEAAFQAVVIPHIWNECPRLKNTLLLWRSSVPVQEQIQFCKYMSSCRGFRCSMWVDFLPPRMAKAHAMVLVILWGPPYR